MISIPKQPVVMYFIMIRQNGKEVECSQINTKIVEEQEHKDILTNNRLKNLDIVLSFSTPNNQMQVWSSDKEKLRHFLCGFDMGQETILDWDGLAERAK